MRESPLCHALNGLRLMPRAPALAADVYSFRWRFVCCAACRLLWKADCLTALTGKCANWLRMMPACTTTKRSTTDTCLHPLRHSPGGRVFEFRTSSRANDQRTRKLPKGFCTSPHGSNLELKSIHDSNVSELEFSANKRYAPSKSAQGLQLSAHEIF